MKKITTIFIAFVLYFNTFTANAHASTVGGWSVGGGIAQGASTVYNGTKTALVNGKEIIKKGTAKITPPASGVAKVLARGVAGYALSVAVQEMLGAVDWVLDPANNQIKYTAKCTGSTCLPESGVYAVLCKGQNCSVSETVFDKFLSVKGYPDEFAAKRALCEQNGGYRISAPITCIKYTTNGDEILGQVDTFYFDVATKPENETKTLPLPTIAERIISKAEQGDTDAQVVTAAAAADIVQEAEQDDAKAPPITTQFDKSAAYETDGTATGEATQTETKTDPQTGETTTQPKVTDLSLEFPKFCGWAPVVCEAAQTVISFPQTLTQWWDTSKSKAESWAESISQSWADAKEWATSETKDSDTELDIEDPTLPDIDTDFNFGGSCPVDKEAQINMGVGIIKMPISFEPMCTTLDTAKPVIIFIGFFISALIIGGIKE